MGNILNKIKEAIETMYNQLILLPDRIDTVTFDENFVVTKFLGLIHYILGTPLYALFCLFLLIGAGFILYNIAKKIINVIGIILPKIKEMFIIP